MPEQIPAEWRELLLLIPGYDALATAEGCRFDPSAAQTAIDFFPECIRHVEGEMANRPFTLERWQQAIVANLFGWRRLDELGRIVRRFTEVLVYIPRKNGKTPFAAGIALLIFFVSSEAGQQAYIAAESREQAGKLFRQAKGMVQAEPELESRCRIYGGTAQAGQSKSLVKREDETSFLQVISADANSQHGGNTSLAIVDELHAQPNRELIDVLTTSTASLNRRAPLLIYLTTADYERPSICNEKHDYACKVRDGVIQDARFLPVVYEATKDDAWDSEATWRKANPNLGVSVSLEYLKHECKRAKESPAYENTFRRLHLNQKTEQAERVIPMDRWEECRKEIDRDAMEGRYCYGALDIGAKSDFCAWVLLFPEDDAEQVEVMDDPENQVSRIIVRRSYTLLPFFWIPERPVKRDPRMELVIAGWRRAGFVKTTDGDETDYDVVFSDIVDLHGHYPLNMIAFDRGFQGVAIGRKMVEHFGREKVVDFPQGILSMNPPFRELLELIGLRKLRHDGNPVLKWMAGNTAAERKGGLMKPSKEKSVEKIDGITALTMCLGIALSDPNAGPSSYETQGITFFGG